MDTGDGMTAGKHRVVELMQAGRFGEALGLCTRVCEDAQSDAEAWYFLGVIHGQLGHFEEAETCCRTALGLEPIMQVCITTWASP